MPYVTSIERRGFEQGLQQGVQLAGCLVLMKLLRRRFGAAAELLRERLTGLSIEQLEALVDAALAAQSPDEFIAALPPAGSHIN